MNFSKTATIFICVISLLFLIGFTAHCISQNIDKIDATITENVNATYELSWAHNTMIENQHLYGNHPELMRKDGYDALQKFSNYIKAFGTAGHLISKPLFCKMLKFATTTDAMLNQDGSINADKLMGLSDYLITKHDLVSSLWEEQQAKHGFFYGVSTLFGDDAVKKWNRYDCPNIPNENS
jgi:hypothetical protein